MKYIVIEWPESQYLYDIEGYRNHCYLINDSYGIEKFGSSAYFVEEDWYNENFSTDED
jgi:hypothetical protein